MAPRYKLTYFGMKGLAEPVRYLLSYMEADWEDDRTNQEQWATVKDGSPWGKLPILEEDGKQLTQSLSMMRYLGKKAGLAGKDDWENAQIDIIADTLTDLRLALVPFWYEKDEQVKKAKKETWLQETLPFYFKKFDAIVKNNRGYLANGRLSWADLLFASLVDLFSFAADSADVTADFPHLLALKNKVTSIPQISQWISKRPHSAY